MRKIAAIFSFVALGVAMPAIAQEAEKAEFPSPNEIVDKAAPEEWRAIAASDLLVMELVPDTAGKKRSVVIQLMPEPFSQGWIRNIRKLAGAHWWDGTSINRVQDNYVVQWGDASEKDAEKAKALPESQTAGVGQGRSGLIPVVLVLLVVILGAGAAVYFVSNEMGRNVTPPTLETSGLDPAVTEANYIRVGWQKEAYQVLRDYMAATSSDGKLPHIRNGEALRTRLDDF